ncbi:MAG: SRPBCC family protein [Nitrososphaerota archaeon]|nr:SRPBCC family protein [Nitrososphaerota archaeon]
MLLEGDIRLPSDREKVWDFVSAPSKIIECVPGLQSFTVGENDRISATVKVAIGFIRGTFQATSKVVKEDHDAHTAVLELSGSGAGSGFSATVDIAIAEAGAESELKWKADVKISGPLGSLAKPLIEGNVKKIVNQLFDCVKTKLS